MFLRSIVVVCLCLAGCKSKTEESKTEAPPSEAPAAEPSPGKKRLEDAGIALGVETRGQVKGEEFVYKAGDTELKGFLAVDKSFDDKRPGIIVVHEWWGHNRFVRKRATMLASLGYTAIALDMYGDGKTAAHPDDAKKFMMEVISNFDVMKKRFEAAATLLRDHPTVDPERIGAIGYCFGGAVVLNMARSGADLDGVVSFHGDLSAVTKAEPGAVKAKMLVLTGGADPFVPAEKVSEFEKEMKAAKVDYELISYPGAKHAFTNPDADENGKKFQIPLAYDQTADKESWTKMKEFFKELFSAS